MPKKIQEVIRYVLCATRFCILFFSLGSLTFVQSSSSRSGPWFTGTNAFFFFFLEVGAGVVVMSAGSTVPGGVETIGVDSDDRGCD